VQVSISQGPFNSTLIRLCHWLKFYHYLLRQVISFF